jgi:hypothetical protein
MKTLLLVTLVAFFISGSVRAQGFESVRPGVRLRLTLNDSKKPLVGTLESYGADTVWIRHDKHTTSAIPLDRLKQAQFSQGMRGHAGIGALIGFLAGAAIAIPTGLSCDCGEPETAAAVFTGILGGLGAGFGAILGAAAKTEAWSPVSLPPVQRAATPGMPVPTIRVSLFP